MASPLDAKPMNRDDTSPILPAGSGGTHAHHMESVEIQTSNVANVVSLACCPLTVLYSWWTLNPREEALIFNCGLLTDHVKEPGCHFNSCWGREIKTISLAQVSLDLMNQRITDSQGNPIVVGAVITYRVVNAKDAILNVQNVQAYMMAQATAALKTVVSKYSYEELKAETEEVQLRLVQFLQPRVDVAGVLVASVSLNELNYASEIASAMLKKQAAQALIDARQLIVTGAISIATQAVRSLEQQGVAMDDHEKFQLASSLLIVTAGDKDATPTLSVGP